MVDLGVSICNGYMCIVPYIYIYIYMKCIQCKGFPETYARLEGWGQSAMGICALCYIYMKYMWCNAFPEIYAQLEEGGWGQFAMGICALCYTYVTYLV